MIRKIDFNRNKPCRYLLCKYPSAKDYGELNPITIKKKYIEYRPPIELQPYLICFWSFESNKDSLIKESKPILPDGCIDIIFDLNPSSIQKSFVVGAMTKPITNTKKNLLGIRFKPGMAHLFLKHPMNEFTDQIIDFYNFFGNEATYISEQLAPLLTIESQISLLNKIMKKQISKFLPMNKQMMLALGYIFETKGKFNVIKLSNHIGWSRQHFTRTCLRYTGLTPNYLSQVLRINNLISQFNNNFPDSLCSLSLSNGFYDQSHMINVFKKITGIPPAKYFD